jgi:hypothetical protein
MEAQTQDNVHVVTVVVNTKPVTFDVLKATGSQIKATAIAQGVEIQPSFQLFEVKGDGLKPVPDDKEVTLHANQEFRAVTPDDNS